MGLSMKCCEVELGGQYFSVDAMGDAVSGGFNGNEATQSKKEEEEEREAQDDT